MHQRPTASHCCVFTKQSDRPDYQDLGTLLHAPPGPKPDKQRVPCAEATLLPKLLVHFAEFPNLLLPAMPKAPSLGPLMRFSVRNAPRRTAPFTPDAKPQNAQAPWRAYSDTQHDACRAHAVS